MNLCDMRQMDNPMDILESIADALVASEASRVRRNAGAGRLITPPSPGTPLLVSLALFDFAFKPKAGDLFKGQFVVKLLLGPRNGAPGHSASPIQGSFKRALQASN